ncbi:MAG: hypothetical protein NVSMB27_36810 [Ktedonobacteraceae bacterium]
MPGAFPIMPPPNPEDNHEETAEQIEYEKKISTMPAVEDEPLTTDAIHRTVEVQYETNGGPLGCCLGIVVGIMLSLFLGVIGFGLLIANWIVFLTHADPATNVRIATAIFALVGAVLGGYLGWIIGKRLYRDYELSPRRQARLDRLNQRQLARSRQRR